jgi:TPR repeat protein
VNAGGMTAKECYEMGKNYENGKNGKPKDVRKAFQYYLKAAEMGCADAYWCVGLEYMYGPGLDKNYVEAVRWFKKNYEAHSWSTTSAKCIGECYRDGGYGLTANRDEAIRWFREAANKGNDDAKKALRDMGVR